MPQDTPNLYEDAPEGGGAPASQEEQGGAGKTALANKSSFPGDCKPGSTYQITVTAVHGDEVEFTVGNGADKAEAPQEQPEAPQGGGMRAMLED
jgi:hypothetical protein